MRCTGCYEPSLSGQQGRRATGLGAACPWPPVHAPAISTAGQPPRPSGQLSLSTPGPCTLCFLPASGARRVWKADTKEKGPGRRAQVLEWAPCPPLGRGETQDSQGSRANFRNMKGSHLETNTTEPETQMTAASQCRAAATAGTQVRSPGEWRAAQRHTRTRVRRTHLPIPWAAPASSTERGLHGAVTTCNSKHVFLPSKATPA